MFPVIYLTLLFIPPSRLSLRFWVSLLRVWPVVLTSCCSTSHIFCKLLESQVRGAREGKLGGCGDRTCSQTCFWSKKVSKKKKLRTNYILILAQKYPTKKLQMIQKNIKWRLKKFFLRKYRQKGPRWFKNEP